MRDSILTNKPPLIHTSSNQYEVTVNQSFFKPKEKNKEYPIPQLELLDDMVATVKDKHILPDLSNTIFIGVQHILETTVTLFDSLIAIGIKPENMYFSGKCYSTSPEIEQQVRKRGINLMPSNKPEEPGEYQKYCTKGITKMWELCVEEISQKRVDMIIILDEGGRCLETMPEFIGLNYRVAAIEQTRGGLYSEAVALLPFPLIEVASSAVKKILEPPLIAEAILNRFKLLLGGLNPPQNTIFGIVGNGAIGYGLCRYILSQGYKVVVYDQNENAFENIVEVTFFRLSSIESVISSANIIFGCTGKDITEGIDVLSIVKKEKRFISCTSEDKEFKSLLRLMSSKHAVAVDTLSDIVCLSHNDSKIIVAQGGFPFNFDRKPWNVPARDIEVTQGLLLGACIQAMTSATKPVSDGKTINKGSRQSLNPFIQSFVALHWLKKRNIEKHAAQKTEAFANIEWIKKNSGGEYHQNSLIGICFNAEKNVTSISNTPIIKAKL